MSWLIVRSCCNSIELLVLPLNFQFFLYFYMFGVFLACDNIHHPGDKLNAINLNQASL